MKKEVMKVPKAINIFPTLRAEMARKNLETQDIAEHIGIHRITLGRKLAGKYELTLSEALKIGELFPDVDLRKLFQKV
jgi:DNA-binding XRE family transcriptional regulator